jgi:hypothetical protein
MQSATAAAGKDLQNSIMHFPLWVAHTEFTLRPRFARTGVVGHDNWGLALLRRDLIALIELRPDTFTAVPAAA